MLSLKTTRSETADRIAGKAVHVAKPDLEPVRATDLDPLIDALNRALYRKSAYSVSPGRD